MVTVGYFQDQYKQLRRHLPNNVYQKDSIKIIKNRYLPIPRITDNWIDESMIPTTNSVETQLLSKSLFENKIKITHQQSVSLNNRGRLFLFGEGKLGTKSLLTRNSSAIATPIYFIPYTKSTSIINAFSESNPKLTIEDKNRNELSLDAKLFIIKGDVFLSNNRIFTSYNPTLSSFIGVYNTIVTIDRTTCRKIWSFNNFY